MEVGSLIEFRELSFLPMTNTSMIDSFQLVALIVRTPSHPSTIKKVFNPITCSQKLIEK